MALSMFLRSSSRLPAALINASRFNSVQIAQTSPLLINKINNVRAITTTPVRQSGNHVRLWQAERVLSLGLLGLVPAALIAPSEATDYLVSLAIVLHFHWGLEAIVTDYVREALFGKVLPKLTHAALLLFSAATLAGLFLMAYNDHGISKTVKSIWKLEPHY